MKDQPLPTVVRCRDGATGRSPLLRALSVRIRNGTSGSGRCRILPRVGQWVVTRGSIGRRRSATF